MPPSPSVDPVSVSKRRRFAVLMAGGSGTRFWPWSRADRPKQLLKFNGRRPMLAETIERIRGVVSAEQILVVTGKRLRRSVARAAAALPASSILCEPVGRNTAPCIGWAALEALHVDPDAVMIVLPVDHVVAPTSAFRAAVEQAINLADASRSLVTFGIEPSQPSTGYGYLQAGRPVAGTGGALRVRSFHEKPSPARAKRFLSAGGYYWNSGMFAWRADVILEEIRRHVPRLAGALERLERGRRGRRIGQAAIDRVYPRLESISIDHAVMEKSDHVLMLPATFEWSDIGSWDALPDLWPADAAGNCTHDPLIAVEAENNVVATNGKPVALLGVDNLAVVDSGDVILVCARERAQDVREIVAALKAAGLEKLE